MAVISHPGDTPPKIKYGNFTSFVFGVFIMMYIYRQDGAYLSYLVDRNKHAYTHWKALRVTFYMIQGLRYTTATEKVIDKTVSHYVAYYSEML